MRGLVPYLNKKEGVDLKHSAVMKFSYNAFNQTSCHHLIVKSVEKPSSIKKDVIFSCPNCNGALELENASYFCYQCHRGYPIFDGIPVLDVDYALGISRTAQ